MQRPFDFYLVRDNESPVFWEVKGCKARKHRNYVFAECVQNIKTDMVSGGFGEARFSMSPILLQSRTDFNRVIAYADTETGEIFVWALPEYIEQVEEKWTTGKVQTGGFSAIGAKLNVKDCSYSYHPETGWRR